MKELGATSHNSCNRYLLYHLHRDLINEDTLHSYYTNIHKKNRTVESIIAVPSTDPNEIKSGTAPKIDP